MKNNKLWFQYRKNVKIISFAKTKYKNIYDKYLCLGLNTLVFQFLQLIYYNTFTDYNTNNKTI